MKTAAPASSMKAIEITQPGGPEVLALTERPVPQPTATELLVKVHAAGVNAPDVLQRKGLYAPPPGASDIPGLEIAGEVVATGSRTSRFRVGDQVLGLVAGGGYAEYCVVDETNAQHFPVGFSAVQAAAIPETFMTVWANVFQRGKLRADDIVLIHGGTSGIGTTACMLAHAFGAAKIITTVGSAHHREASLKLGADVAVLYREEDFVEHTRRATNGHGADLIVDIIGGDYVARNYEAAAMNGRIVQIGLLGGKVKDLDLFPLLSKRLTHMGSTLRSRSIAEKAKILSELKEKVWPLFEKGEVCPQIFETFPLEQAVEAHRLLDSSKHVGKVVLTLQ
jgi:NADPH2:quinone reductase